MMKKITKNKTVFKEYFRDPQAVWIYSDDNFKEESKKYKFLNEIKNFEINYSLNDSDDFRYKTKILKKEIDPYDYPEPILDGLEVNIYSNQYFKNKFKHLDCIDMNIDRPYDKFSQWWQPSVDESIKLLKEKDNFILFEGCFEYKGFKMRPDVLIKEKGKVRLIEVKATSFPKEEHAYDVSYQILIFNALGFNTKDWKINLCTLNKFYKHNIKYSFEEVAQRVFKDDWINYFSSSPFNLSRKIDGKEIKLSPEESLERSLENAIKKHKYIKDFYENLTFIKNQKTLFVKDNFEILLQDIVDIQNQDSMKIDKDEKVNPSWNKIGGSYYLPYFLQKAGVEIISVSFNSASGEEEMDEQSSLISYKTNDDSIFAIKRLLFKDKAFLYNEGIKTILEVDIQHLLTKEQQKKFLENPFSIDEHEKVINFLTKHPSKKLMQKYSLFLKKINKDNILYNKNFILKELEKYSHPIYMFDFETLKTAIPRFEQTSPYEQVPYQFSIHVIVSEREIIHYEWLAENIENMYEEFWKNFYNKIFSIHGKGTYVSYNKSFEKMVIRSFVKKDNLINIQSTMEEIIENCVDLMDFFKDGHYYAPDFIGSHSIKVVGKHFAKDLDYAKLEEIQKGDQSSKQAKFWIMKDSILFKELFPNYDLSFFEKKWIKSRKNMLKYCEYDTLSMVKIYQGIVNNFLDKN